MYRFCGPAVDKSSGGGVLATVKCNREWWWEGVVVIFLRECYISAVIFNE